MAGSFPQDLIAAVRQAGDLVQLVSEYVPLKPAGARLKGLCPFHQEKTPSFSVDPRAQLFYCFGCNTGGDLFKFVMLYEQIPFGEAAELLARRFGVPLPARDGHGVVEDESARLLRMNRAAEAYFRSMLHEPRTAADCRAYLEQRRLNEATVERLGLGYAPDGWEALRSHLLGKGFKPQELERGGFVLTRKTGSGQYDRFRDRLMFPIRDAAGRTVAFGGRGLGDGVEPKYLNSPETPAYKKGEHLYGLDLAKEVIRREGFAIVVEGYLDLAALVQAGFEHAVASLGTAFTAEQARLLARYTRRVVVSYDGDAAGAAATVRSLDLLLSKGFEVRVVELPAGTDPDDHIGRHGAEAYRDLLQRAPDYLEFLIRRESAARDLGRIEEQVAAANAILPHVAQLASPIARAAWAGRIADALRIEDGLVLQELRGLVKASRPRVRERLPAARSPREAEQRLVSELLRSAEARGRCAAELDLDELGESAVRPIVEAVVTLTREGRDVGYQTVFDQLDEGADRDLLTRIAFRDEPETGPSVADCLWAFKRERLARRGREARREIAELQRGEVPPDEVNRRLAELEQLARERDAFLNCEEQ